MNTQQRQRLKKELKMKRCKYCRVVENLTIDHKVPRILGGTDEIKNLQVLCQRCNGIKSQMSDKQVRYLWRWFWHIQNSRIEHGTKPYNFNF